MAKRRGTTEGAAQPQPRSPIDVALERGDIRTARRLAAGSEDRAKKEGVLERTRPDPVALGIAAAVLLVIVLAAWLALFRTH